MSDRLEGVDKLEEKEFESWWNLSDAEKLYDEVKP
jgi:hypothetical protein